MKRQLRGIALILLGMLFVLAEIAAPNMGRYKVIGIVLGIVGIIVTFLKDETKIKRAAVSVFDTAALIIEW